MTDHPKHYLRLLIGGALSAFFWTAVPAASATPANAPAPLTPLLEAQIRLDRLGISPGEIDGVAGENSTKAIAEFQRRARRKVADGRLDWLTRRQLRHRTKVPALALHKISAEEAAGPFVAIPSEPADQAKLQSMGYTSLKEALGERFHASPELLEALNPGARFAAGETLRVPNVLPPPPVPDPKAAAKPESAASPLAKIIVSKSGREMRGLDGKGATVFYAPVSSGSEHDPLPIGSWRVNGVARNPVFHYNPDLFWDADPGDEKATLPAGPNNPVGVGWIDLSKEHYGLHGTPSPGTVGHAESHGCVRLTNWDALRLMARVEPGTPVEFVE